jgi:GTPase
MACLPPEIEEGNIEYKRQLCSLSRYRFQQLQSQMKWRIDEGKGTAIYLIGVDDDGTIFKLDTKDRKESLKNIKKIAIQIDCYIDSIIYKNFYYEIIIKKNVKKLDFIEKRIVFFGNSDSGKSTLISILCGNDYDNGSGSARLSLFNHKHEMFTGITSSISIQTFDKNNKKIALIDLPGKNKYKKTKYYGLLSYDPELAIIVLDNNTTIKNIKHIYLILRFLNIPIQFVKTKDDLIDPIKNINLPEIDQLISVSCVDGSNIELLKERISKDYTILINNKDNKDKKDKYLSESLLDNATIFQISEVYYLTDLGLIVSGILLSGELETMMKMKLGPFTNENKYYDIIISSIHCYQTPYNKLNQDHIGTIVIKFKNSKINIKDIYNKISKNCYLSNYELYLNDIVHCKIKYLSDNRLKDNKKIMIYLRNNIVEGEILELDNIIDDKFDIKCKIKLNKFTFIKTFDKFIFDNGIYKGFGLIY